MPNIYNMKKASIIVILLVIVGEFIFAQSSDAVVRRLSDKEIAESKTPAAVTYNFVCSILQKDYTKMQLYCDISPNEAQEIEDYINASGETYETLYSKEKNIVALLRWLPALNEGFEVVIADMEDVWLAKTDDGWMVHPDQIVKDGMVYIPGEEKPYVGIHEKIVYVTCSPSVEINTLTFENISCYEDTQLEVFLRLKEDKWVVKSIHFISQFKQKLIEGTWYLQEVQIPSNEEYLEGVLYDKNKCIVLNSMADEEVLEEAVVDDESFNNAFEESYEEEVVYMEEYNEEVVNEKTNNNVADTVELNNLIRELYLLSGVKYEILCDSVLVLYCPQKEIYEIKRLTKNILMLAENNTPQGYIIYVYGRKEQPIRYTKHKINNR